MTHQLLGVRAALLAKPFLVLTGLSGSGKTQLALKFAKWISIKQNNTLYSLLEESLRSEKIKGNYRVVNCNRLTVELVNSSGDSGKIIPLPVQAIYEWFNALKKGLISNKDDPKESRHVVGNASVYQKYIHGFYGEFKKIASEMLDIENVKNQAEGQRVKRITQRDFPAGVKISSARSVYQIRDVDRLGVKVSQSGNSTLTFLPFDLIEHWAKVIGENDFNGSTPSQVMQEKVNSSGLEYSPTLNSFHSPLKALALYALNNENSEYTQSQYNLVAVGADWTSNENLLGYPDALKPNSYRKPDNGVLDLLLAAIRDRENPYFLILDEMNLSHVERYFSDFLSAMESGEPITLHDDTGADWDGVPAKITIPKNLFVIGTVNIDETTYMFSPKVLDRANVIEFRVTDDEMQKFLENPVKPDLDAIAGKGSQYARAFVQQASLTNVDLEDGIKGKVSSVLMKFFPVLKKDGAEFGYRSANEICRFIYFNKMLGGDDWKFEKAMDAAIMQKLLPKLHGSKKKLMPVLESLMRLCFKDEVLKDNKDEIKDEIITEDNAVYWRSLEKLGRMRKRLQDHGFTSFTEA